MTEKEKKDYYIKRVERDLAGNPNDPRRNRIPKTKFPPPTQEEEERMKKLDHYGNPLPGYGWKDGKIVSAIEALQHKILRDMKQTKKKDNGQRTRKS